MTNSIYDPIQLTLLMSFLEVMTFIQSSYLLLLEFGNEYMGSYIPVAPITTDQYTKEQYQHIDVPTYIVYGKLFENIALVR